MTRTKDIANARELARLRVAARLDKQDNEQAIETYDFEWVGREPFLFHDGDDDDELRPR